MGCNTSTTVSLTPPTPDAVTGSGDGKLLSTDPENFSERQKKIVRRTWKIMSSDMCGNGVKVFLKIFAINPLLKSLFPFGGKHDDELQDDYIFKAHASRFMQAVGAAVDHIGDLDAKMGPLFINLGMDHHYKGFKPDYWTIFLEAMMSVWANELGSKFTIDAQLTWKAVFDFIMNKLREGYAIAQDEDTKKTQNGVMKHHGGHK